jgi:hypothetical protein
LLVLFCLERSQRVFYGSEVFFETLTGCS